MSATTPTTHNLGDGPRQRGAHLDVGRALLACGLLYAVLYPVVNDGIAATAYEGYDRMSQAVSELSATGAPTRTFLMVLSPLFVVLQVAFGVGIWRAAGGKRSVRIAGALMVAHGVASLLWIVAPMSRREVIAAGGSTSADTMHLVLAAGTGLFVAAYVTVLAIGFGWRFRVYSALTLVTALVFGRLSAQVEQIEAGDPTPWMGLLERVGMGAWLLWMVVAGVLLLLRQRPQRQPQSQPQSQPQVAVTSEP